MQWDNFLFHLTLQGREIFLIVSKSTQLLLVWVSLWMAPFQVIIVVHVDAVGIANSLEIIFLLV